MSRTFSYLGGGIHGVVPKPIITTDRTEDVFQTRFLLRQAWNNNYKRLTDYNKTPVTPFRAVTNAGDLYSRQNYSCGGACQTYQSRPRIYGFKTKVGHIVSTCDDSGVPPSSCNTKYVYDSSNYTRYMKEKAINQLYDDRSFGGDQSRANQSIIKAIRRY